MWIFVIDVCISNMVQHCVRCRDLLCVCALPMRLRRRYNVMSSLIGWVYTQNDLCRCDKCQNSYNGSVFLFHQKNRYSSMLAMELRPSCINTSKSPIIAIVWYFHPAWLVFHSKLTFILLLMAKALMENITLLSYQIFITIALGHPIIEVAMKENLWENIADVAVIKSVLVFSYIQLTLKPMQVLHMEYSPTIIYHRSCFQLSTLSRKAVGWLLLVHENIGYQK